MSTLRCRPVRGAGWISIPITRNPNELTRCLDFFPLPHGRAVLRATPSNCGLTMSTRSPPVSVAFANDSMTRVSGYERVETVSSTCPPAGFVANIGSFVRQLAVLLRSVSQSCPCPTSTAATWALLDEVARR